MLAVFGSGVLVMTEAVLVTVRGGPAIVTTMSAWADPGPGIVPKLAVTVPAAKPHVPWVGAQETNVTPTGSVSVIVEAAAAAVPVFVTRTRYVTVPPAATVAGMLVFVKTRSGTMGATIQGNR